MSNRLRTNVIFNQLRISRNSFRQVKRIFGFIRPYRWYFLGGLVLLCTSSLIFMIFPGAAGEMANAATGNSRFHLTVRQYGYLFLVILVLQGIFSYLRTVLFAIVSEKGMADIRKALYDKLITQPVFFFEARRVGELTSRITADVEQLQSAFSITLAEFLRQIVILISGVGILVWLAPKLSMIMLLSFPFVVILAIVFGRFIKKLSRQRQDQLAKTNTIVDETLQSFYVVKSFTNEWFESRRYANSVKTIVSISLRFARTRGLFFVFIITVLFGGIFFVLWRGALFVEQGELAVGDLFSFIIYTGLIGGAIATIGNMYTSLASALGASERILEILGQESEVQIRDLESESVPRLKGVITFKDVSFSYPTRSDIQILKQISFHVESGKKVALVGVSGAGKSTIAQLILRFYDLDRGQILIDGKDIREYDLSSLRKNMAIVPQEVLLFGGTIRENLLYGKSGAKESELILAAQRANAWGFIQSFPEGLDTVVGERGIKLSGGQRQRIAIARAILRDPSILILDEATSSLDAESENAVQLALNALMENRTSVIIAHRLSTIRDVDCIYVIENGQIVEQGTHWELAGIKDGAYSSLARLQLETTE